MQKKLMKWLDEMCEELHGARSYAKCYIAYKEEDPARAKMFYEMAEDELKHARNFHGLVENLTKQMIDSDPALASFLTSVWDDKNGYYVDETVEIKMILSL